MSGLISPVETALMIGKSGAEHEGAALE